MKPQSEFAVRFTIPAARLIAPVLLLVYGPIVRADAFDPALYVEAAIVSIRDVALRAPEVDWESVSVEAHRLAAGAREPADAYGAIRYLLQSLGDGHSFLQLSVEARDRERSRHPTPEIEAPASLSPFAYRSQPSLALLNVGDSVAAHIVVPGAFGPRTIRYARRLRWLVDASESACGVIVDLRGNGGGDMWPMVLGLYPLLGDGVFGGDLDREGQANRYFTGPVASGLMTPDQERRTFAHLSAGEVSALQLQKPVAVLLDHGTGSSGEAVAIAFVGRPLTRSFGRATAGVSTSNIGVALPDSENMVLTVAVMTDRAGKPFDHGVTPDQPIDPPGPDTRRDPDLRAAITWLQTQGDCGREAAADQ